MKRPQGLEYPGYPSNYPRQPPERINPPPIGVVQAPIQKQDVTPTTESSLYTASRESRHIHVMIPIAVLVILIGGLLLFYLLLMREPTGSYEPASFYDASLQGVEDTYIPAGSEGVVAGSDTTVISDHTLRDRAFDTLDPDVCLGISDFNRRNMCVYYVADYANKPDYCARIQSRVGEFSQPGCYSNIAINNLDSNTCYYILETEGKYSLSYCLFKLAELEYSPSYCDLITLEEGEYSSEACKKMFEVV